MSLWEEVWQTDKAAEARAVAGIAYKVRQLLNAKRGQEAGVPVHELGRKFMLWGPPQRVQAELNAFSTRQLELMLCRLLEADVAAKSGGASVQASIESLIISVCRAKRTRVRAGT